MSNDVFLALISSKSKVSSDVQTRIDQLKYLCVFMEGKVCITTKGVDGKRNFFDFFLIDDRLGLKFISHMLGDTSQRCNI
jgi:hypothetical protein